MLLKKYSVQNPGMDTWVASMLVDPKDYFDKRAKAQAAENAASGVGSAKGGGAVEGWLKELQAKVDEVAPRSAFPPAGGRDAGMEKSAARMSSGHLSPTRRSPPRRWTRRVGPSRRTASAYRWSRFRSGRSRSRCPAEMVPAALLQLGRGLFRRGQL